MNAKIERIIQLDRIFRQRRTPITKANLADQLDVAEKTIGRDLAVLQDQLNAPLENTPNLGYRYNDPDNLFQLPGIWLSSDELIGLATLLELLQQMHNQPFARELADINQRVAAFLQAHQIQADDLRNTLKIIPSHKQAHSNQTFASISQALLQQQRLQLSYRSYQGRSTERQVSPQRLIHYQENWYLDAYCHLRDDLRQFRLSRIKTVKPDKTATAKRLDEQVLQQHFASAYGIFAGKATRTVKLRFFDQAAHEVAQQQWHPEQIGQWQGRDYLLSFPYHKDEELLRDILKHANNVEVIAPSKLRQKVARIAGYMTEVYSGRRGK